MAMRFGDFLAGGRSPTGFVLRLLASGVFVLLGAFPLLAALGLIGSDQPIEPLAIPFVVLFGLVFLAIGAALVAGPLLELAAERGARHHSARLALCVRLLRARIDARSAGAALGVGALGAACWLHLAGISMPLLGDRASLTAAVVVEFLTIHAFPFLVVAAVLLTNGPPAIRWVGGLVAATTGAASLAAAWRFGGGIAGVAWFVYLLAPNVLVFVGRGHSQSALVHGASRWCLKFALFTLISAIAGGGDLASAATVWVGALYFTALALADLLRVDEIPLDLARAWSAGPQRDAPRMPEAPGPSAE